MANKNPNPKYENLKDKDFRSRDPEEMKRIASLGGQASGEAKRNKRLMADVLMDLLDMEIAEGVTVRDKGSQALLNKFAKGDLKAYEIVRDTIGEKPTERVEVKANIDPQVERMEEYFRSKAK